MGFTPTQIDGMEMWQVAVLLGGEDTDTRDLTYERILAARGERPAPEPRAVDATMVEGIRRLGG